MVKKTRMHKKNERLLEELIIFKEKDIEREEILGIISLAAGEINSAFEEYQQTNKNTQSMH